MTDNNMTCSDCDELFADYFEGDLATDQTARVDSHVASCARCQGLVRDLDDIRETAASLPELVPSRDLWQGIEARIQPAVVSIAPRRAATAIPRSWLATAAAGLIVVSSSITYVATSRSVRQDSTAAPAAAVRVPGATVRAPAQAQPTVTPAAREAASPRDSRAAPAVVRRVPRASVTQVSSRTVPPAELALSSEIDELQALLETRRTALEPETIRVVEENLAIIDAAVRQARAAVERDPGSGFLSGRLESALQKKVQLLRTVALIRSST
jgi:hypothetical protein